MTRVTVNTALTQTKSLLVHQGTIFVVDGWESPGRELPNNLILILLVHYNPSFQLLKCVLPFIGVLSELTSNLITVLITPSCKLESVPSVIIKRMLI
jgi:hypothetical protein